MLLSKQELCDLIPHAGSMCLLDAVVRWDESEITCIANSHKDLDHPLRNGNRLAAISGIEYAAQAMAVHGGLLSGIIDKPVTGYLAALRNIKLSIETLDHIDNVLTIIARRLAGDSHGFIYEFTIKSENDVLFSGRATVINKQKEEA